MEDRMLRQRVNLLALEISAYMWQTHRKLLVLEGKAGFDPGQPRVPAGDADGGQWTDAGGGEGEGSDEDRPTAGIFDRTFGIMPAYGDMLPREDSKLNDMIRHLEENAHSKTQHACARYVRLAIKAGGMDIGLPSIRKGETYAFARDFGEVLMNKGHFKAVAASLKPAFYPPPAYKPRKGDIVVIQNTSKSKEGHMAMYTGNSWISDFRQQGFWPGEAYVRERPSYVIYRLPWK